MAYTLEQVREAARRAREAGDEGAAQKLLQYAIRLRMQQQPEERVLPTEGMSTLDRLRAGIGQGMYNVARHVGNFVGLVSDEDLAEARALDAPLLDTTAGKIGSFIGETATLPVPMMGATGGLMRAGGLAARAVGGAIRRGAVEGAAQGAIMADPGERLAGAIYGGAFGTLLPAAGRAVGTVARGLPRTAEAERLLAEGVELTPGQLNPRGIMAHIEESAESVPFIGPAIRGAREQARTQFQQAVVRKGAAPGAEIPAGDVHEMLDAAYRSFEPLYNEAKGFPVVPAVMRTQGGNVPLTQLFRQAAGSKGVRATDETRRSVGRWLSNLLTQFDGTSDGLIAMRSQIRAEARRARLSSSAEERAAADLLDNAERAVTQVLESQLPREALQALRLADSKYGTYKVIEDAVAAAKDAPGGFTSHQLSTAIRSATDKSAYARGAGGPLRELATAGREVFDVRSPPTGQRLLTVGLPLGAIAAKPVVGIPVTAGMLGLTATRTGRRLAAGTTAPQRRLAESLLNLENLPQPARVLPGLYARSLLAAATNE